MAWIAALCGVLALSNMRTVDMDTKNLLTSFTMIGMSLVMAYVGRRSEKMKDTQTRQVGPQAASYK